MPVYNFNLAFRADVRGSAEVEADTVQEAIYKLRDDAELVQGAWISLTGIDSENAYSHRIIDVSRAGVPIADDIYLCHPYSYALMPKEHLERYLSQNPIIEPVFVPPAPVVNPADPVSPNTIHLGTVPEGALLTDVEVANMLRAGPGRVIPIGEPGFAFRAATPPVRARVPFQEELDAVLWQAANEDAPQGVTLTRYTDIDSNFLERRTSMKICIENIRAVTIYAYGRDDSAKMSELPGDFRDHKLRIYSLICLIADNIAARRKLEQSRAEADPPHIDRLKQITDNLPA